MRKPTSKRSANTPNGQIRKNGLKSIYSKAKALFLRNGHFRTTFNGKHEVHDISINLAMERKIANKINQIYMEEIEDIERFVTNR